MPNVFDQIHAEASAPPSGNVFDQIHTENTENPSLVSDALKYSPVGMVKSLADALRDPGHALSGIIDSARENAKLLDKAKESFHSGDYTGAAAHFLNYLVPGGAGLEDAGQDFAHGDIAHGLAKTAGLASTLLTGAKAPQILEGAGSAADSASAGAATLKRVATDPAVIREGVKIIPKGAQAVKFYDTVKAASKAPEVAAAVNPDAELLNGIAQGTFKLKDFASAPPEAQAIIQRLADASKRPPPPTQAAPAVAPQAASVAPQPAPQAPIPAPAVESPPVPAPEAPATTAPDDLEETLMKSLGLTKDSPILKNFRDEVAKKGEETAAKAAKTGEEIHQQNQIAMAARLGKGLQEMGYDSPQILDAMGPAHWTAVARELGEEPPSAGTIQRVKDLLAMGQK